MALTNSEIAASLAETIGLTKEQAVQTLNALAALAYKNAKDSFTIPGLGKVVLVGRKTAVGDSSRETRRKSMRTIPRISPSMTSIQSAIMTQPLFDSWMHLTGRRWLVSPDRMSLSRRRWRDLTNEWSTGGAGRDDAKRP